MKAIVKIKPNGKSLRRLLRHCYLREGPGGREIEPLREDGNRVAGVLWSAPGAITGKAALDAQSLGAGISDRGQYRHVVLSLEDMADASLRKIGMKCLIGAGEGIFQGVLPEH